MAIGSCVDHITDSEDGKYENSRHWTKATVLILGYGGGKYGVSKGTSNKKICAVYKKTIYSGQIILTLFFRNQYADGISAETRGVYHHMDYLPGYSLLPDCRIGHIRDDSSFQDIAGHHHGKSAGCA